MDKTRAKKLVYSVILLSTFAGSVFATSSKFTDAVIVPKNFFAIGGLSLLLIYIALNPNSLRKEVLLSDSILKGVFLIVVIQAIYGLCQYTPFFESNHVDFPITGSFENPAGLASLLSIGFPIGLYLIKKSVGLRKMLVIAFTVTVAVTITLSGSRTGVLALVLSSFVFYLIQPDTWYFIRQLKLLSLLIVLIVFLLISGIMILYRMDMNSANGRILIWRVSLEMIRDQPLSGHGAGSFQAKYMDYQAEYFTKNVDSKFKYLADNVKHPFNIFIKLTVEFGIPVLLLTLFLILCVTLWILKQGELLGGLILAAITSFLVFAFFSYPLRYASVWVLLVSFSSILLHSKEIKYQSVIVLNLGRIALVLACVFAIYNLCWRIVSEVKWKQCAENALIGTEINFLQEYESLYQSSFKRNPFFLYNYGAELSIAGEFDQSNKILYECKEQLNDYDLQLIMANNFYQMQEYERAIATYQYAAKMIPNRFLPVFNQFEIYKELRNEKMALYLAKLLVEKKVKVSSATVSYIQSCAKAFIDENQ